MFKIFRTTAKIIFGQGAVRAVGEEAKAIAAKKALIVTDPGILNAGLSKSLEESLSGSGIDYAIFGDVEADPCNLELRVEFGQCHSVAGVWTRDGVSDDRTSPIRQIRSQGDPAWRDGRSYRFEGGCLESR